MGKTFNVPAKTLRRKFKEGGYYTKDGYYTKGGLGNHRPILSNAFDVSSRTKYALNGYKRQDFYGLATKNLWRLVFEIV